MGKNIDHIQHIKSNVVTEGKPKLPIASALVEGELAINYATGYETISIKNANGDIVRFSCDDYYSSQKLGSGFTGSNSANTVTQVIEDNELVWTNTFLALSGAVSSHTEDDDIHLTTTEKTNLDSLATNIATISGITSSDVNSWNGKVNITDYETKLGSAFTGDYSAATITQVIEDNEEITAAALTDLKVNKTDLSAFTDHITDTDMHLSSDEKENLDSLETNIATISGITPTKVGNWDSAYEKVSGITASTAAINSLSGSVDSMAFQSTSSYSSKTEIDTALAGKANTGDIVNFFDGAKYELSGTTHVINFYHGSTRIDNATINAEDFIVDGMIDTVTIQPSGDTTVLVITWNAQAGKTQTILDIGDIFEADNYYTKTNIDDKLGSGFTGDNSGNTVTQVIEDNEEAIASLINDLNDRKVDISALEEKLGMAFTGENSGNTVTQVIKDDEEIVSSALNDLNERKMDISAFTEEIADYYTKSETSGATEISDALSGSSHWDEAYLKAPAYTYSAITANINSFTSPIESGETNNNKQAHVLFHNTGSTQVTVTVPTTYKTPDGGAIELTIPAGGFAEVNCLVLNGMIFVRAV